MDAQTMAALVSIPAAIAVIYTVKLFLGFLTTQREEDRLTWTNHLSKSVETQEHVAVALTRLTDKIESMGK